MDHRAERALQYLAGLADQHDNTVQELRKLGKRTIQDDMIVPLRICRLAREWRDDPKRK